jgi:hypothetical protein
MTFKTHQTSVRTLKQGDRHFNITDKFVVTPRAGFEISKDCPYNHLQILQTCIDRGWIKPVAHVTERELIFMGLTNE